VSVCAFSPSSSPPSPYETNNYDELLINNDREIPFDRMELVADLHAASMRKLVVELEELLRLSRQLSR
jgi:hypothetical protein